MKKKSGKSRKVPTITKKREMVWKDEGQEYGLVVKLLGNCRVQCLCGDGQTRICHIRGKFQKRIWISSNDVVLVSVRDFQEDKGDIIYKYNMDEIQLLKEEGCLLMDDSLFSSDYNHNNHNNHNDQKKEEKIQGEEYFETTILVDDVSIEMI